MSEFRLSIDLHKGEILITFDKAYSWISLPPASARKVAEDLLRLAAEAEPSKPRLSG